MNRLAFALCASAVLCALPAQAKEGDTFRPFVSYTHYYDNNLFRLADDESTFVVQNGNPVPINRDNASDQYGVLSAGLNVDWQPGRQHVIASAAKNAVRFQRYSALDYDGSDYQAKWNWRLGNYFSGQVGATERVTQSSFTDLTLDGLEAVNNEVTRDTRFASADWQFHPRWHVGVRGATAESSNSALTERDHTARSIAATVGYATPKRSALRAQFRRTRGEFPNRDALDDRARAYTQTEYGLQGDWAVSAKLVARAQGGHVARRHESFPERDYSGLAGRLSADYRPTGKTQFTAAVYREVQNAEDLDANYALTTGGSLGAAWVPTAKLTVRANVSVENRKLEGDVPPQPNLPRRDEDTLSGTLSLSYAPVRMATIDLGVQAGRRDSNRDAYDYAFRAVFVSLRADF